MSSFDKGFLNLVFKFIIFFDPRKFHFDPRKFYLDPRKFYLDPRKFYLDPRNFFFDPATHAPTQPTYPRNLAVSLFAYSCKTHLKSLIENCNTTKPKKCKL